jgi:DNA polymerase alpha subunit A
MSKVDRRSRLAELRALRQSGKKAFDSYQVDEVQPLYEEVDEDGYKMIVRDRLNQDDFVVDDNGEGYADDGREEWDRVPAQYDSESDDDMTGHGRPSKAGQFVFFHRLFSQITILFEARDVCSNWVTY